MALEAEDANGKKKNSTKLTDTCLLIDYMEEFAEKSINELNVDGWENFKILETGLENTPADIISAMTSRGGLDEFMNMDNTTLGLLVPKIKLFKQYYQNENDVVGKSVEYLFDDSLDGDRIDAMTRSGLSRSGGAGIKEVSWEFNGTNPAEAERVISVSMTLVFQSAYDLLGDRYDPIAGNILAIDPDQDFLGDDGVQYTKNYVDLILHPPSRTDAFGGKAREDEVGNKYVPKFYRLKMLVGWAVPEGTFPNLGNQPSKEYVDGEAPKSRTEKLKEELKAMELSIFLNLVSHQFNMRENGQIELTIDYKGSFEETINGNSANVLVVGDFNEKRKQQVESDLQTLQNTEELIDFKRRQLADLEKRLSCLDLSDDQQKEKAESIEKYIKDQTEFISDLGEEAEEFDDNSKSIIYKQFLERINMRVKSFVMNETQANNWKKSTEEGYSLRPKFDTIVNNIMFDYDRSNLTDAAIAAVEFGDQSAEEQQEDVNAAIEERKKQRENRAINYIYLGDILNLACELAMPQYNKEMDSNMRILTGPVALTHPRGNKIIHMNLADIPIAYDDFQIFFFETVVRKELASYPLNSFIKDILEVLIKKVLQPRECFAKGREQRQIDIGMTNFTIRSSVAEQIGLDKSNLSGRFEITPSTFNLQNPEGSDPDTEYNCMLLYMTSYASYDLVADELEDRKKGIYHYYIGAETGLIQKIEFSRSDIQGLREARQSESRNLGQIRDVYNANVRMVGNTIYIPGMKVFLNPPVGFGRPEASTVKPDESTGRQGMYGSLANLLGIGGYYDVLKVQSTISRGSVFSTELDCAFAQSGGESDKIRSMCKEVRKKYGFTEETEDD